MTNPKPVFPRVLIVDDDAGMRETIGDNFEALGYEHGEAATGAEAIDRAAYGRFDVILMDYNLPDTTGLETIRRLRAAGAASEFVMLTGREDAEVTVGAIDEAACAFLVKPAAFPDVRRAVDRAWEKKRLRDENKSLIAELRVANLQLAQFNEQLERLSQMKSRFLAMASHDLANTVMGLQAGYELLVASLGGDEALDAEQKKRLAYIGGAIKQVGHLIQDLVDWESIEQGKLRVSPEPISAAAIIEEAMPGPQARAKAKGIDVSVEIMPSLSPILGDRNRLLQVLNNLLENAIRHTTTGGRITVSLRSLGSEVVFAVKDTGEGLPAGEADKIFASFYQAESRAGGGRMGLGLSIAKEVLEAHHGRIWVESAGPDKGATFQFAVPVAPGLGKP